MIVSGNIPNSTTNQRFNLVVFQTHQQTNRLILKEALQVAVMFQI
ncbi:hypothetical protein SAMN02927937_01758 [Paenimyroides aquimaris]|uniref:Uncharacterized protein n=1 Tax=Paenimyroides marinum TaxID=1159016 RepID=A0A1H6L952_9FLAO|nr:hypothetical protein SAMN02927937_01758 [Paenimyroides aquimaris]